MSDRPRRELDERLEELEATVADLREELEGRRGPMGVPSPPRPREFLRFADEYAIPAAISALEANVRALEMLQAGIRASDPERAVDETGRAVRDRASGVGRASLERLDRALAEVEAALEGSGTPRNREASDLLADARELNEEIRGMIDSRGPTRSAGADRSEAVRIEVRDESEADGDEVDGGDGDEETAAGATEAEVEAELEAVREEVESEGDGTPNDADEGEE